MKDKNIDKLFRDGLDERRIKPKVDSWSKIEAGLNHDVKKVPSTILSFSNLMKFAAAFVTLVASLWIFNSNSSSSIGVNISDASVIPATSECHTQDSPTQMEESMPTLAFDIQPNVATTVHSKNNLSKAQVGSQTLASKTDQPRHQVLVNSENNPYNTSEVTTDNNSVSEEMAHSYIDEQDQSKPIEVKFAGLKLKLNKGPKIKGISHEEIASMVDKDDDDDNNDDNNSGLFQNIFKISKPIINSIADRNYNDIAIADK